MFKYLNRCGKCKLIPGSKVLIWIWMLAACSHCDENYTTMSWDKLTHHIFIKPPENHGKYVFVYFILLVSAWKQSFPHSTQTHKISVERPGRRLLRSNQDLVKRFWSRTTSHYSGQWINDGMWLLFSDCICVQLQCEGTSSSKIVYFLLVLVR